MSEVKRYDPMGYDRLSGYMQQHPEGDYVRHADYAALEAECERWKYRCQYNANTAHEVAAERDALAAELAAIKGQEPVGHVYTMQHCFPAHPAERHEASNMGQDQAEDCDQETCEPTGCACKQSNAKQDQGDVQRLREALEWYAEKAKQCRKIGADGDNARQALDLDGGFRALDALAASTGQEVGK